MYSKRAIAEFNYSNLAKVNTPGAFFMELRDYIEAGSKKAGSTAALARYLDMNQPDVANAKAHKRGLPLDACFKLAKFIDEDLEAVIAASQLVTEKNEKKRAFWLPFVSVERLAHHLTFAAVVICANAIVVKAVELASLSASHGIQHRHRRLQTAGC